jgi:predicted amidophosphoribosyltransferase
LIADLLVRTRRTPSQGGLNGAERRANAKAVMAVRRRCEPAVAGKRILLIDDVLTTGATADSCAQALRTAGAKAILVLVLVLARIVRPERYPI